jgi:phosphoglycerate dehydrogenase-like enzyme
MGKSMTKSLLRVAVASRSFSENPELRAELTARYPDSTFNRTGRRLDREELIKFLQGHDKAITALETIDEALLKSVPSLKLISKYGVGLDMIDLHAMDRMGVLLGWTGGVNKRSVAELTLTFFLLLMRGIYHSNAETRAGRWAQTTGRELAGKTVGIVGCGHVGQDVVRLLRPFGCVVLINDIRELSDVCKLHSIDQVPLETLLGQSDIVSLHVPLDSSTRNLMNVERLRRMKKGAFLVNTARGGVVDESALKEQLKSGALAGAAFDVFASEPPQDLELIHLPNFLGTPHIGGSTPEAILAMGRAAIENLERGRPALECLAFQAK